MSAATQLARASIAHHSKSFALASRLLSRDGRDEASIVYAWCRRADDAVDVCPAAEQHGAVASLKRELEGIYAGDAQPNPVLAAFQGVVERRGIPADYPSELLAGMEMDAARATYPDYDTLLTYCFRVAGTVGLMMSHVMGVRDPVALRHAAHLGMAMQITNVCRDVREDWDRARLYLPDELLARKGVPNVRALLGGELPEDAREGIANVVHELLHRAGALYESGDRGIPLLSWRSAVAVRTARLVYADIGRVILDRGADPFAPRATVGTARKLLLVARACAGILFSVPRHFEPTPLHGALGFHDVVPI